MSPDTKTLLVSIAGLTGTLAMGSLGLYFTAKTRNLPSRQALYTKQIELAQRMSRTIGACINLTILLVPDGEFEERARDDLRRLARRLHLQTQDAALLYPVEVYASAKCVSEALVNALTAYDEGEAIEAPRSELRAHAAKHALMTRQLLGVEELSFETLSLHSDPKEMAKLDQLNLDIFLELDQKANAPSKAQRD